MAIAAAPEPKANMGQPVPRIDATLKVTGGAKYPSDIAVPDTVYACIVTSSVAVGEITGLDLEAARNQPGIIEIFTHKELTGLRKKPKMMGAEGEAGYSSSTHMPMETTKIEHDGQIVAIIVGDTFEAASEAAYLVEAKYSTSPAAASFGASGVTLQTAAKLKSQHQDPQIGDAKKALLEAAVKVDAKYSTPTQHHNPIELFHDDLQMGRTQADDL